MLGLASKGALWNIKDFVWKDVIEGFVVKRKGHPGLVWSDKTYKSLLDTVPVMIGSSSHHRKAFRVERVFPPDKSEKEYTYFRTFRPCMLPAATEDGHGSFAVKNFKGDADGITRNHHKPSLNSEEMKELDKYIQAKGLKI